MAKRVRTVTEMTDDIDGTEAVETVSFALDGAAYTIDLNEKNAAALRDALAHYVGHAQKVGRASGGRGRPAGARKPGGNVSEVRAWAKEHGHAVSERGRISADIQAAYEAAH